MSIYTPTRNEAKSLSTFIDNALKSLTEHSNHYKVWKALRNLENADDSHTFFLDAVKSHLNFKQHDFTLVERGDKARLWIESGNLATRLTFLKERPQHSMDHNNSMDITIEVDICLHAAFRQF